MIFAHPWLLLLLLLLPVLAWLKGRRGAPPARRNGSDAAAPHSSSRL